MDPDSGVSEVAEEKKLAQEFKKIRDTNMDNKKGKVEEVELLTTIKCITPKCSRKAAYNFCDNPLPMFCDQHKYEGMVDVVSGLGGTGFVPGENGKGKHVGHGHGGDPSRV